MASDKIHNSFNPEFFYQQAVNFTKSHYENFPVVSLFIKKELRKHVAVIYQFARQADDIADEGNLTGEERLKQLDDYEKNFVDCLNNKPSNGFWLVLSETVKTKNLSAGNFLSLLKAFRQDVKKKRYANFNELLDYCKNSANPVGRIILELHNINNSKAFGYSDDICTALQLTNFYQDVNPDFQKGRIYIPQNELERFKIPEEYFEQKIINENFRELIKFQIERTEKLFESGKNLLNYLPFMLRWQIKLTIKGGEAILGKIKKNNFDVLNKRPTLSKIDFVKMIFK